jgi:5-methylcytosine-specific restriction endonuclease McrA
MTGPPDLSPNCPKCRHRHLPALRCWAGRYSQQLANATFTLYGDTCWLCGFPGADTCDHVQPRARGGTDTLANLRPAHRFCNTGRGASDATPAGSTVHTEQSPRW